MFLYFFFQYFLVDDDAAAAVRLLSVGGPTRRATSPHTGHVLGPPVLRSTGADAAEAVGRSSECRSRRRHVWYSDRRSGAYFQREGHEPVEGIHCEAVRLCRGLVTSVENRSRETGVWPAVDRSKRGRRPPVFPSCAAHAFGTFGWGVGVAIIVLRSAAGHRCCYDYRRRPRPTSGRDQRELVKKEKSSCHLF